MKNPGLRILAIGVAMIPAIYGQAQRQAVITGGGSPEQGKCTLEVVVDGVANVEIRGNSATLRNLSGQPPQWRRFVCTGAMPANPPDFRFAGVDGRGRQELIRDPRNGGVAVVQIEDKDGGSEGYTFDIMWDSRAGNGRFDSNQRPGVNPGGYRDNDPNQRPGGNPGGNPGINRDNDPNRDRSDGRYDRYQERDAYRPNYRDTDYYRRFGHGFAIEEAVRVCRDEVMRQASRKFRGSDIHFNRTTIDNNPGRQDWVTGSLDVHRGRREQRYGFSCSVDFDSGRVRSAELDPRPMQ